MKRLTKAEEQVMQVLWNLGKAFVRDIIEKMPAPKPAYNTVSTIIRILEGKGFVSHSVLGKTHQYYPLVQRDEYSKFYLDTLLTNYFGGKFDRLVSFFVQENNMSLEEFEQMLKHVEKDLQQPDTDND